ncbi:MAG TPA: hypothetical protein VJT73_09580 [Polyangiaceae bacterium]|nr:hypothetical protein [Polyangiaceae bacterium]
MNREMTEPRFRELLQAYGADFTRWPASLREAAEAFAVARPASATWVDEQRAVDRLLDDAPALDPSPALLRSIAEIPLRHPVAENSGFEPFARFRTALFGFALAAAMGVFAGFAVPEADDTEASWDDFSEIALALDLSEEIAP